MRAVSIGAFDGIHLGHKEVIERALNYAYSRKIKSTVLTFSPHPARFFKGENFKLLTTEEEKDKILKSLGVDEVIKLEFNKALANMPPELFFKEILLNKLNARFISVGFNFTFGKGGEGTPSLLTELAKRYGIGVEITPPKAVMGRIVSSTIIRKLISEGKVGEGALLLGRSYTLQGVVVRGDGLGRKLGFPTANLSIPPEKLLPPNGVYAVLVKLDGKRFLGAMNIGYRPTILDRREKRVVEVHLLDFNGDLYGEIIETEILRRIRSEMKFSSLQELKKQIEKDVLWAVKHYAAIFSDSSTSLANSS